MSPYRDIPFVRAALLDNAGLIGAAALGRAQALEASRGQAMPPISAATLPIT